MKTTRSTLALGCYTELKKDIVTQSRTSRPSWGKWVFSGTGALAQAGGVAGVCDVNSLLYLSNCSIRKLRPYGTHYRKTDERELVPTDSAKGEKELRRADHGGVPQQSPIRRAKCLLRAGSLPHCAV
jgi:hypothetical protein